MMRTNRLAAMCLALAGGISATVTLAGTNGAATSEQPSSAELSFLAAELADTAARLAQLQETYSSTEKITEKNSEDISASGETKSTVHWLSSNSNQLANNARIDIEILPAIAADPAIATDFGETGARVPRPAAIGYRQAPLALPAPATPTIIHAQANEDVFYTDQADQNLVQAAQGELSPQPDQIVWGDPVFCSDGCSDSCCSPAPCCPKPRPRRILVVGTEAVFLDADINGQRIGYRFEDFSAPTIPLAQFGPDYGEASIDDFYITPRLWLGVQGERWGVVGRYFHMRVGEHDHDPFDPFAPVGEHSFDVNSIFEAYYTDLEVTRNFCVHGSKNQFTFGARYALIEHHENLYARTLADEGIYTAYGRSNRQAHGTGITFGLNGRKPLFCNSCAHWFYNVRSSILWGCTHNEVETQATADVSLDIGAGAVTGAQASVNDDLFIGEVQLGIEWDFALRCLPAKSFFRAAFEYQYWDASSGFAESGAFAGIGTPSTDSRIDVNASAPGLIVDLIGFSVGTGFTW